MAQIPRDDGFDSTLALLSDGYTFISSRCERLETDVFETRLMLRRAFCAWGEEAARMFYHPDRFTRKGALPPTALMLLQDRGSVQTLDGQAHRHRKHMFMALMTPESIRRLADIMAEEWRDRVAEWESSGRVVLHSEVREILCRAACRWTGVPLTDDEAKQRTRELGAMITGAGAIGPRNWKGLALRTRTERWARGLIDDVRDGTLVAPEDSGLHAAAFHRDPDGELLDTKVAAVELINLLRPTVAVARYVVFSALALHQHPERREELRDGGDAEREGFVQEVRRYYPFFPVVAGRAREEFEWRGQHFDGGAWFLLDIYGTNRDPRSWDDPDEFRPERFRGRQPSPHDLIPQGGGDHLFGHRCAGEWATIALMKKATDLLVSGMSYEVPEQDLQIDLSRMPAIPKSRFVIREVQRV